MIIQGYILKVKWDVLDLKKLKSLVSHLNLSAEGKEAFINAADRSHIKIVGNFTDFEFA
jgi:hypothetical protein